MAKQELLGEVKKLISIGKEKGFLTYDELNSTLPAEVVSSEQIRQLMRCSVKWILRLSIPPRANVSRSRGIRRTGRRS